MDITPSQAVEELIAHVEMQCRMRQLAKDAGEKYLPTREQKSERDRLLRRLLATLGITRSDLIFQLKIDRGTWDRWRIMATVPHRVHLEGIIRIATGNSLTATGHANVLITQATAAMLNALGITKGQLDGLEWLERMQDAAGIELGEQACRALLVERQANRNRG